MRLFSRVFGVACVSTVLAVSALAQGGFQNNLMPQPKSLQVASGEGFIVKPGTTVALKTARSPRLEAGVLRAMKRLEDASGVPLPRSIGTATGGNIVVDAASDGEAVQGLDEDESYALTSSAGGVTIKAATTVGALHGLETLLQLLQPAGSGYVIPGVTIEDSPRFRWRGLHIDCSRHFEPIEVLKRNLDAMAAVKLNVFHWHLTDDQGFRMESKIFPKLTGVGSDGLYYTQDDARELVAYARARGIRVVPEFEMPGHSVAWLIAYPELNSGTQPEGIRREFGVSDIALDPTRDATYTFIEKFLAEMAPIFPDQYVHIGGDETPAPDWKKNARILAFKKAHNLKDNDALQAYFNTRLLTILTKLHKRMEGWDEILTPELPKDIVIQSWRGEASLGKGAAMGYQGVLSAPYYLDGMKPAGVMYLADPVPADTKLTPEQQKLILGGEVCMWAEHLDRRTIDSRIWPRTAALAERFWSPQSVRDVDDMYRRLEPVSLELETVSARHLTSEDAGLRSLSDSVFTGQLRRFADAFEPVSFGERYQQQHTSQLTPLTGFVDAVVPDPPQKHRLEEAAREAIAGTGDGRMALRTFFEASQGSVPAAQAIIAANPRLQPMKTRAEQLLVLDGIGLEALRYLDSGKVAPAEWVSASKASIAEAKKPSAIVRFIFLDSLTKLVDAAGGAK